MLAGRIAIWDSLRLLLGLGELGLYGLGVRFEVGVRVLISFEKLLFS